MQRLILVLVAACSTPATTAAGHEDLARHYSATAASIEKECWKARRNELTVGDPQPCWKTDDIRFLTANRNAASYHHAEAARLRRVEEAKALSASR